MPSSCLVQHVDEQQLLYTFRRPDGGPMDCALHDGEMLLLSVDGACMGRGEAGWDQRCSHACMHACCSDCCCWATSPPQRLPTCPPAPPVALPSLAL